MGKAWRYWQRVRMTETGIKRQEISDIKAFFQQQFPDLTDVSEVPDATVQRQLLQVLRSQNSSAQRLSEYCLRCYISNLIEQICQNLAAQFGERGFTAADLLSFVLDDVEDWQPSRHSVQTGSQYQSLATKILQTFDPEQSNLSTWTKRLVYSHRELTEFLLEHEVYLISNWAILNAIRTPNQLRRILLEYSFTDKEIQQACCLLESYHAVYRADRLQQKTSKRQCQSPTVAQLNQINEQLKFKGLRDYSLQEITHQLRSLAQKLRQYRIMVRTNKLPTESLDSPENTARIAEQSTLSFEEEDSLNEFLTAYRQTFLTCLDSAIEKVVSDRLAYLGRNPPKNKRFLTALFLFHCQGRSMSNIAPHVDLKHQYQVARLLKLKEFRADVRQQLLILLRDRVLNLAKQYADPIRLQALDYQLDTFLEEQIDRTITAAAAESFTANRSVQGCFARRLCHYLDYRRIQA